MDKKHVAILKFQTESDEADWWASRAGRETVKRKSGEARAAGIKFSGSALVANLKRKKSAQISPQPPTFADQTGQAWPKPLQAKANRKHAKLSRTELSPVVPEMTSQTGLK